MWVRRWGLWVWAMLFLGPVTLLAGPSREEQLLDAARAVIDEYCTLPVGPIPSALLRNAQGVVVFPSMVRLGAGLGGRHGRGVLLVRQQDGTWSNPVFVVLTGGSVGWQLGLQSSELVLVFKTRRGVEGVLDGQRFTLGTDASVAVGPLGREAEAATDASLKSEIYSFSRSRGLYAGLTFQGSSLRLASRLNEAFYGSAGANPRQVLTDPQFQNETVLALGRALGEKTAAADGTVLADDGLAPPPGPPAVPRELSPLEPPPAGPALVGPERGGNEDRAGALPQPTRRRR